MYRSLNPSYLRFLRTSAERDDDPGSVAVRAIAEGEKESTQVQSKMRYFPLLNFICTQHYDGHFCKKIDNDPTPTLTNIPKLMMNELQPNLQNDVMKLIPYDPHPATFYTIPKVHKLPNLVVSTCPSSNPDNFIIEAQRLNINPPGRPIVSSIRTLNEYVSAFAYRELQPLLANIPSYINDTTDFMNKICRFDILPDNAILVTLDVVTLYSSIAHDNGIGACKEYLDRRALSTTSIEDICKPITSILEKKCI